MVKRVGSKGRLGVFEASEFSTPTFASEQPVSLGEELQRREENALLPGEAILCLIDEMTDFAFKFLLTQGSGRSSIDNAPSNGPEGFANRILLASGDVRNRVMNLGPDARSTTKLLHDALELAAAYHALRMEFVEGPNTAMGQTLRNAQSNGGQAKRAKYQHAQQARRAAWQREANSIWAARPNLKVHSVASLVSSRFAGDADFNAAANTIRAQIRKPDDLHSTPSVD